MAVGSVVNAIAILRHVAMLPRQGVNAIARSLGLSPSSCFNILKTLVEEGFVDFDPATKSYSLGDEPARLFRAEAEPAAWKDWAHQALAEIAQGFAVTCGLWKLSGGKVTLIEVAESPGDTRIHLSPGQRLPAYLGAMGRCIAAAEQLPVEVVGQRIAALRWQDPPSADTFWAEAREAARRGWAIDESRYLKGLTTIAGAVADPHGTIRYCLTATMFTGQHDAETKEAIGYRVAAVSSEAAKRLAGRSAPAPAKDRAA